MPHREALDMRFVDDRVVPWHVLAAGLAMPVEIGIHHHAFRHERCAVAFVECQVVTGFQLIAEHRWVPLQLPRMRAGVRVKQQLVRIEAVAGLRFVRPVHAVAVERCQVRRRTDNHGRSGWCIPAVQSGQFRVFRRCSNRQISTFVAWAENRAKLVPAPSHVAPRGKGSPSLTR